MLDRRIAGLWVWVRGSGLRLTGGLVGPFPVEVLGLFFVAQGRLFFFRQAIKLFVRLKGIPFLFLLFLLFFLLLFHFQLGFRKRV